MVHQEIAFCENLSVSENLCLGDIPRTGLFILRGEMNERAARALRDIGCDIDVTRSVASLPIGQQQLVQIAGAVAGGAEIMIFDEPTSSLSRVEAARLMDMIRSLKAKGVTCVYVSHRLEEIFEICDDVSVLRDGRHIGTKPVREVDKDALIQMMVGRAGVEFLSSRKPTGSADDALRVEGLSSPGKFESVGFSVKHGEIVGMAGLVGSGRTEVAEAIFGLDRKASGNVYVNGGKASIRGPSDAMALGIGLIPEDRKRHGLVLGMSSMENISLASLRRLSDWGWISAPRERELALRHFDQLKVKAPSVDTKAVSLSGGNQQKLVIAKWLASGCRILLVDEPTRGVDVGAKAEIHALIDQLAGEGSAVLLISSELPELLSLSDRILVMRNGRLAGSLDRPDFDQEKILRLMTGTETHA